MTSEPIAGRKFTTKEEQILGHLLRSPIYSADDLSAKRACGALSRGGLIVLTEPQGTAQLQYWTLAPKGRDVIKSLDTLATTTLLPCPFCGGDPTIEFWHGGRLTKRLVACGNPDCYVQPSTTGETESQAVMHWNHRAIF